MAETSGTTPNSEFSNYFKLLKLLHKSSDVLRHLFVTQWNSMNAKTKWEDSDSNRQEFINGLGKALHKKSQKIQREYLSSRNIADWDLPLLIQTAKCLQVKAPFEIFEQLKLLRNKLSHLGEPKVSDEKYNEYWKEISILLLKLDIKPEVIDKVQSTPLEQIDPSSEKLDPKAEVLRNLGNEAFKKALYDTSIDHYTDGILLPGLSSKDLALLYANRSVAFLKSGDIRSAKDDAKVSIHLCPAWWKGYYRLAKAYIANDKYQFALKNFTLAQEFHEKASELDGDIDLCKRLIVQHSREEHFDAIYFSKTYEELAKCVPNLTSELVKLGDNKFGKASGMCRQGHSHRLGRDRLLQDDKEAASWYSKAAAEGNAEGMYNLAIMTIFGKGIQCNILEGILLLNKAASQPKIDLSSAAEYRKAITLVHRKSSKDLKSAFNILDHFNPASQIPKRTFKLSNLKPIFLQDVKEKNVDHIYEDYVLKLTIMEDPLVIPWKPTPFINSIVCDEQGSYERLCVYNYNPSKEELQKNLGFGTAISIRNPYYKITSGERKAIFVDDFCTIFVHHNLKNEKICRYCGDKNDTEQAIPCRSCKKCYYCSKKCLRLDLLELEHDITCKKVV